MESLKNELYTNDNLYVLNGLNSKSVDLIYLDPPFNSKRTYSAPIGSKAAGASFKDMWTWQDVNEEYLEKLIEKYPSLVKYIEAVECIHSRSMMAYITYMAQRIIEMHRILKDTGSIYLHCDPTASHYLKIVLDEIFGKENFLNEIVWCYSNSGRNKTKFTSKHDIILLYSKTKRYYWDYMVPISEKYLSSHYRQLDENGNRCRIRVDAGKKRVYYPEKGITCNDWWIDIPSLNSVAKERTGYPTQKPLALLKRIIEASSREGDVVLDPFCGCATTCVAAQQMNRRWIGIDIEKQAVEVLIERLKDDAGLFSNFIHRTDTPERTDIKKEYKTDTITRKLYVEQEGRCNGCGVKKPEEELDIDCKVPSKKGSGYYFSNYQLLCKECRIKKIERRTEYLSTKIKLRQELLQKSITFGGLKRYK